MTEGRTLMIQVHQCKKGDNSFVQTLRWESRIFSGSDDTAAANITILVAVHRFYRRYCLHGDASEVFKQQRVGGCGLDLRAHDYSLFSSRAHCDLDNRSLNTKGDNTGQEIWLPLTSRPSE
jgi:hypothetical protein